MKTCPKCKKELNANDRFCGSCGENVSNVKPNSNKNKNSHKKSKSSSDSKDMASMLADLGIKPLEEVSIEESNMKGIMKGRENFQKRKLKTVNKNGGSSQVKNKIKTDETDNKVPKKRKNESSEIKDKHIEGKYIKKESSNIDKIVSVNKKVVKSSTEPILFNKDAYIDDIEVALGFFSEDKYKEYIDKEIVVNHISSFDFSKPNSLPGANRVAKDIYDKIKSHVDEIELEKKMRAEKEKQDALDKERKERQKKLERKQEEIKAEPEIIVEEEEDDIIFELVDDNSSGSVFSDGDIVFDIMEEDNIIGEKTVSDDRSFEDLSKVPSDENIEVVSSNNVEDIIKRREEERKKKEAEEQRILEEKRKREEEKRLEESRKSKIEDSISSTSDVVFDDIIGDVKQPWEITAEEREDMLNKTSSKTIEDIDSVFDDSSSKFAVEQQVGNLKFKKMADEVEDEKKQLEFKKRQEKERKEQEDLKKLSGRKDIELLKERKAKITEQMVAKRKVSVIDQDMDEDIPEGVISSSYYNNVLPIDHDLDHGKKDFKDVLRMAAPFIGTAIIIFATLKLTFR